MSKASVIVHRHPFQVISNITLALSKELATLCRKQHALIKRTELNELRGRDTFNYCSVVNYHGIWSWWPLDAAAWLIIETCR